MFPVAKAPAEYGVPIGLLGAGVDGAALPAGPPRGDVSQAADEEGAAGVACGIGDGARASVATRGGSMAVAVSTTPTSRSDSRSHFT